MFLILFATFFLSVPVSAQQNAGKVKTTALRKASKGIVSVRIEGAQSMTFGADPDTPASNVYKVVVMGADGVIPEKKLRKSADFKVVWDIEGFKTANDTQGQYCDSYGAFAVNGANSLATDFQLRDVPMNFHGKLTATVTCYGQTMKAAMAVEAIGYRGIAPESQSAVTNTSYSAEVESGRHYTVKVTFRGTLTTGRVSEDLAGYTLGTHEDMATEEYTVACVGDKIELNVTGSGAITPCIESVTLTLLPRREKRKKRVVHHIGDSTSANNGSWAYRLSKSQSAYPELFALCDFSNRGAGGRNLCTYYAQGKLAAVLNDIYPGDIVMLGDNGTNGMGKSFEEDMNYYLDAAEAFGAQIVINSYTPHGAVSRWAKGYNAETNTFDSHRRDAYEGVVRKIAAEREQGDTNFLGFVEIGKNADAIFNAYVADYSANGHASKEAAAQDIIGCFTDHNHYSNGTLACDLMLGGYKTAEAKGIVAQLIEILSK